VYYTFYSFVYTYIFVVAENVFQSSTSSTLIGFAIGVVFLIATKAILDRFESVEISDISSADLNKMFLIIFVMTLHSLTEGIGIGVSFGGHTGMQFGPFVSLSLALHNVPEGLAVALVLSQRKVNVLRAGKWKYTYIYYYCYPNYLLIIYDFNM